MAKVGSRAQPADTHPSLFPTPSPWLASFRWLWAASPVCLSPCQRPCACVLNEPKQGLPLQNLSCLLMSEKAGPFGCFLNGAQARTVHLS